jgi:hypothetical protein
VGDDRWLKTSFDFWCATRAMSSALRTSLRTRGYDTSRSYGDEGTIIHCRAATSRNSPNA